MGKFIIGTFLVLGWGFYEMSGGSDFVPETRETVLASAKVAPPEKQVEEVLVTRAMIEPLIKLDPIEEVVEAIPAVAVAPEIVAEPIEVAVVEDVPAAAPEVEVAPLDLRSVAGTRVNMRSGPGTNFGVVQSWPEGTSAEVIEVNSDGWARIRIVDTGDIGWMAERLLSRG